jgi:hypothetical protein
MEKDRTEFVDLSQNNLDIVNELSDLWHQLAILTNAILKK